MKNKPKCNISFDKLDNFGPYYVICPGTEAQLQSMPAFTARQLMSEKK